MFVRVTVCLAAGGLLAVKALPHIYPHKYVKGTMELKVDSREVLVPERCKEQLARIAPKLGFNDKHDKIAFFVSKSLFPMSAGATWLPNGAVIGVPVSFFFKHENDVARFQQIQHQGGRIPFQFESKTGNKLKETLLMSDDNVAFLIGHELSHIRHVDCAYQLLLAPSWLLITFKLANSTRRFIPRTRFVVDGICKISICLLSYFCYWRIQRELNHYQEFKADEDCARSDLSVAQGGVDWALKTMRFNSLMRMIHEGGTTRLQSAERSGPKGYTHPQLVDRLRKLEVIVDEILKESGISSRGGPIMP